MASRARSLRGLRAASSDGLADACAPLLKSSGQLAFLSTSAPAEAQAPAPAQGSPLVELRTYAVRPDGLSDYLRLSAETAPLRRRLTPGWMGFWTTETGGNLGEVKHMYRYDGGWAQREAARAGMQADPDWARSYIPAIRPLLHAQHSMILVEDQDCMDAVAEARLVIRDAAPGGEAQGAPVFELRRYELVPGYQSMPALKKHMLHGLPSRVAAQECGECIFMGHSEVGLLNVFLELWRYDSTTQCTLARRAARSSPEWRQSIAGIAEVTASFRTEYLRATAFSPAR